MSFCKIFFIQLLFINVDSFVTNNRFNKFTVNSVSDDYLSFISTLGPFISSKSNYNPQSPSGGDYLSSIAEAKPFTSTPVPLPVPVAKSQSSSGGDYLTSIGGNIKPIFKSSYIYSFKPGSMPAVKPTTPPGFQPAPVPSIKPVVKAPVLPGFKYGSMPAVKPSVKPDVKNILVM